MRSESVPYPPLREEPAPHARAENQEAVGARASSQFGPLLYLFPGYLLLLVATELLSSYASRAVPSLGPILYGMALGLLLLHAALCWDRPFRCLPLTLSLAPLARLLLFLPAARRLPGLEYYLALGLPVLAVAVSAISLALPLGRSAAPREIGRVVPRWDFPLVARRAIGRIHQLLQAGWARRPRWAHRPDRAIARLLQAGWARWPELRNRIAVQARQWGCTVRQTVDQLARQVAVRLDGAWQQLGLRVLRRAFPRPDHLLWEAAIYAATLILLLGIQSGVRATCGSSAEASTSPAATRASHAFVGGWATGRLVAGGKVAALRQQVSEERPAAFASPATPPAGMVVAAIGSHARTPLPSATEQPARTIRSVPHAAEAYVVFTHTPSPLPTPPPTLIPAPTAVPLPAPVPPPAPVFPADCPAGGYENYYPWGVCTWYAKTARPDLPWFRDDYGMADNWGYSARACGFVVNMEPAAGAVIVFSPGANGASSRGHVGYVEEVGLDYVLISECNAGYDSLYAEAPFWWEAGYPCIYRRIPRDRLDPGIEYIHGRADPAVTSTP